MTGLARVTAFLLAIVAGSIGMRAEAASPERLVMPGDLAQAHAKYEDTCSACHAPFSKVKRDDLCLDCHKEVAQDHRDGTGFHGTSRWVAAKECSHCHSDHLGRDADIVGFDPATFDHRETDFPLDGGHVGVVCGACHKPPAKYRDAPSQCVDCHEADDIHGGEMGRACADCHKTTGWQGAQYDHDKTGFRLTNGHQALDCIQCHPGNRYKAAEGRCASCHAIDDTHGGEMGDKCQDCHTTRSWKTQTFDHDRNTKFPLRGAHAEAQCEACHRNGSFSEKLSTDCIDCHRTDDIHRGRHGDRCADCHTVTAWRPVTFNHDIDTGFPLMGAHSGVHCVSCHEGGIEKRDKPRACVDCHRESDPHKSVLGSDCGRCHDTRDWWQNVRFNHQLTAFPLLGLHQLVPCESCHRDQTFSEKASGCADCHGDEDSHHGAMGKDCASCHNPNGWAFWRFDHQTQTDFPLIGAHGELACTACHTDPVETAGWPGTTCIDCHRTDDRHRGQFGTDCARCHEPTSFKMIKVPQ